MRKYYTFIIVPLVAIAMEGCTKNEPAREDQGPEVAGIVMTLGDKDTNDATRAANDYIVNKSGDPTHTNTDLADRSDWKLDVTIYDGASPYLYGKSTCTLAGRQWKPADSFYFPNYSKQKIDMTLYPASWTPGSSSIAIGQSSSADVLAQDVLTRKEDTPVNPAHILGENEAIQLKHAHSMIDFILKDLDFTDITKIDVLVGSTTYAAYPAIDTSDKKEYLLILPPGTKDNPVIKITTTDSRTYTQTIKIVGDKRTEYGVNTCYCFTLKGIELKLSPITITNWSTGEALEGDYVGVTEYPTFRGPAGKSYELYFDNHLTDTSGNELWQKITFNSRGECTVKPYGRTIIKIRTCGTTPVKERSVNVILREMVIDLNSYISSL